MGKESTSRVTGLYNEIMQCELPKVGIECRVISQLEVEGQPVSASTARRALRNGGWRELRRMVPPTTYEYFASSEANPLLAQLKETGDVDHY